MQIIEALLQNLKDYYVFPEVAEQIAARLRANMAEYAACTSGEELSQRLNAELQAISQDKHLGVYYSSEVVAPQRAPGLPTPEQLAEWDLNTLLTNGGFQKVERLAGNVGYLQLNGMAPAEVAGETAAAAMAFVAGTEALIIDLRESGGGAASMLALLCGYLLRFSTQLSSLWWREGDRTQQLWTPAHIPGKRYLDKPVYVLTSKRTYSAAEQMAYDLQKLERATIVGETTVGAAHPIRRFRLDDHFEVVTPNGRALNPITGSNWQGTGVLPDLAIADTDAFKTAYAEALRRVITKAEQESARPWQVMAGQARQALADLG